MWTDFSHHLLNWYGKNARCLPWRDFPEPYSVWVSEIMLQQTRVETVLPYFERWLKQFPSIESLAAASEEDVLRLWEGLGYYSRARNLHRAAKLLVEEYGGRLPGDAAQLQKIPGIGRYTAGAVASIAFGLDEAALDGNIRRVLARIFDVSVPARSPEGERILWQLAADNLPEGSAGDYNQAMMDLGATICLPRKPLCTQCPVSAFCKSYASGNQEQRPVTSAVSAVPHYIVTAAVIARDGQVLIAKRPDKGLLGGLWEFPGGKLEAGEDLAAALQREIYEELNVEVRVGASMGVYRHAYTHFKVTLHAFRCELVKGEPQPMVASDLRWVSPGELEEFPMGKIDRRIAQRILQSV